jgi:anti-anti-sigma factor
MLCNRLTLCRRRRPHVLPRAAKLLRMLLSRYCDGAVVDIGERRHANILVLAPVGRIDNLTSPEFPARLLAAVTSSADVVIDFSGVEYISSAGLRALTTASRQKPKERRLAAARLNAVVHEIFTISRFSHVVPIFATVEDASATWGAPAQPEAAAPRVEPKADAAATLGVRFWGTRGSLPAPLRERAVRGKIRDALLAARGRAQDTPEAIDAFIDEALPFSVRGTFGGNTSCIEIVTGGDEYVLCDLGTGIREFGNRMPAQHGRGRNYCFHIFLSHPHWDHIMGFPFFARRTLRVTMWLRTLVADLVRPTAEGHPRVLGIDIVFAERDRLSPPEIARVLPGLPSALAEGLTKLPTTDSDLAEAMRTVPTVLALVPGREDTAPSPDPLHPAPLRQAGADPNPFLKNYRSLLRSLPELGAAAQGAGAIAAEPDDDGIVRRVGLAVTYQRTFCSRSFACRRRGRLDLHRHRPVRDRKHKVGGVTISTDGPGRAIRHFAPRLADTFRRSMPSIQPSTPPNCARRSCCSTSPVSASPICSTLHAASCRGSRFMPS